VAAVCIAAAGQGGGVAAPQPRMSRVAAPSAERSRGPAEQRLYYCLERSRSDDSESRGCGGLQLSLWIASPGAATVQPHSATAFEPRSFLSEGRFPRYVGRDDEWILQALTQHGFDSAWPLRKESMELLPRLVATGRAHWGSLQARALRAGAPRQLQLHWQLQGDGTQRLTCDGAAHLVLLLDAAAGFYLDSEAHVLGVIEPASELQSLRELWGSDVAVEQVEALNQRLPARWPRLRHLTVEARAVQSVRAWLLLSAAPAHELRFLYNDVLVEPHHLRSAQVRVVASAAVVHEFERDRRAEEQLHARLEQAIADAQCQDPRTAWLSFMLHAVPALRAEGWEVEIAERFPYRLAPAEAWYTEIAPSTSASRVDPKAWFDLRLSVRIGDQSCNLLPALVDYLQSGMVRAGTAGDTASGHVQIGSTLLLCLEQGYFVPVPMARIERIAQTLVELFDRDALNASHAVSLPRSQASRLLQLEEDPKQLQCHDGALLRLIEELKVTRIEPLAAPEGFRATLRPYQQEGLGWLRFLRRCELGGILADDMGLGKTLQTLAHLLLDKQRRGALQAPHKPTLIVAPVSVIGNWQQELRRFAPELELVVLHGSRRRESFAAVAGCDVALTGYPQLLLDEEFLCSCDFALVVLDEAQMVKNPRTRAAQVARALRAEQRLCLTGTPLENHLGELWSLLDFVQPGLLGEERQFQRWYRTPIEKEGNSQRAAALSRRIAPFLLRRTKDAVATELPDKTQIIESLVLEERQRDFYDAIRLAMHARVQQAIEQQGLARSHITILDALLKLRQACCDPRLVDPELDLGPDVPSRRSIPSVKLQWLATVLPQLAAEGRRVLLFSQFTGMLSLIEAAVREAGIDYCLLTGATRERDAQVARFQSGAVPLFLISLKAGGTGLNLTAADTVIHYDPWWNPAVEAQATDRAHRIGQRQPVFVYKLIAQDTVEEKILKLQARKHELASALYAEAVPISRLSGAELAELLAP
jgi:superfamily II DNA or RNA helicase